MTGGVKSVLAAATLVVLGIAAGVAITLRSRSVQPVSLTGAVLSQSSDPRRQMPIGGAQITASSGPSIGESTSDSSGLFRLALSPRIKPGQLVTLTFRHSGYQPLDLTEPVLGQIYIARMTPVATDVALRATGSEVVITDVSVRYSVKSTTTVNVASFAKIFEVANTGGVPCNGHPPCSPDGKWKATAGSASFDAGENNDFVDARVSCIAGPCPFTKIESDNSLNGGRVIQVSALDWSDTATFLVEAEITRTVSSDMIRRSYPVNFGDAMNFTLPPTAEGPSIEADLNGSAIVFPLGPDLILSWGDCSVKVNADSSRLYRCELKPGYEFR